MRKHVLILAISLVLFIIGFIIGRGVFIRDIGHSLPKVKADEVPATETFYYHPCFTEKCLPVLCVPYSEARVRGNVLILRHPSKVECFVLPCDAAIRTIAVAEESNATGNVR